jgi:hypothetical protein
MNKARPKKGRLITIVALVVCGWLALGAIRPRGGPESLSGVLLAGFLLGTIFGQTALAAAWCALGPFSLVRRLPLSFTWLAAIVVSFGCNIARSRNPNGLAVLLVYGGSVLLQWLLVQAPIWILVIRYGLRVNDGENSASASGKGDQQFGIRQVMILTALVAIVLGIGRFMLGGLKADGSFKDWRGIAMFAFLTVSNAIISIPIIAAALVRRSPVPAICGALLLVAFTTAIEVSLLTYLVPATLGPQFDWTLPLINVFHCGWVLAVLLILRSGGFRLTSRRIAPS